jgi:RimJ/RimL family protein N-acetyltransferase
MPTPYTRNGMASIHFQASRPLRLESSPYRLCANRQTPELFGGLTTKDDLKFIVTCGLFARNRNWRKCSVGYELVMKAQGQGYMYEGLTAALSWGFGAMSLNRIEAQVHPNNQRSVGLLGRLGFAKEGRLRQAAFQSILRHAAVFTRKEITRRPRILAKAGRLL